MKRQFLAGLTAAALACTALSGVQAAEGIVEVSPYTAKTFVLVNKATGSVLTETDATYLNIDFTRVVTAAPKEGEQGAATQQWVFGSLYDGTPALMSAQTGYALHNTNEFYTGYPQDRCMVTYPYEMDSDADRWLVEEAADGYVRLKNNVHQPDEYLAVMQDVQTDNGYCVSAAPYAETDTQLWKLEEITYQPVDYKMQDVLDQLPAGSVSIGGYVGHAVDRVSTEQMNAEDTNWANLVNQFRQNLGAWQTEFWGKMVRGGCITYRYTQDEALYQVLEETARDMLTTQRPEGRYTSYDGTYLANPGTFPPSGTEFTSWDTWGRKYVLLGFLYFYDICRDEALKAEIMVSMRRHADYLLAKIGPEAGKIRITNAAGDWKGLPAVSILEPMVLLYKQTGDPRYLRFCDYIVEEGGMQDGHNIFQMAYENELPPYAYYPGWAKAYEMSSCFEGLAEYARITGSDYWMQAVLNYYAQVRDNEITITGSGGTNNGPNKRGAAGEQWNNAKMVQTDPTISHMQETCVTVTWLRYCYHVLSLTQDSTVADEIEKTIYNALLASYRPEGMVPGSVGNTSKHLFSYFTLMSGVRGVGGGGYIEGVHSCCPANGPSAVELIPFLTVMQSDEGPTVNLYIPGTMQAQTPSGKAVALAIETEYPKEGSVTITVTPEQAEAFKLRLRIPDWSENTAVAVNGEAVAVTPGTYAELSRTWQAGDKITLEFDMRTQVLDSFDGSAYNALRRGPVILARDERFGDGEAMSVVQIKKDADGYATVEAVDTDKFANNMEFSVETLSGDTFLVCDYASAGQTWTKASRFATWLPNEGNHISSTVEYRLQLKKEPLFLNTAEDNNVLTGATGNASFRFVQADGGYYRLLHVQSGQYVSVCEPNADQNEANVALVPYADSKMQMWSSSPADEEGYFALTNAYSGLLLSKNGQTENVHQYDNWNDPNQFWKLVPMSGMEIQRVTVEDNIPTVKIANYNEGPSQVAVMVCSYDGGRLLDVEAKTIDVWPAHIQENVLPMEKPVSGFVKVYLWDCFGTMRPLADVYEKPIN